MILSGSSSTIDFSKMEFIPECSREFPVTCYEYDLCERIEPWHWHDQFEAALIEGGEALLCIEGSEYSLRSGEGYFINSGALHSLSNISGKSCRVRCVVFTKEFVGGFSDSIFWRKYLLPLEERCNFSGCVLSTKAEWQLKICRCIEKIFSLCKNETDMYEIESRELVTKIIAIASENTAQRPPAKEKAGNNYISKVKTMLLYIWQNYQRQITLFDIARAGAISKNECMLCFNKTVGTSPIQYLKSYRLEKAEELLLLTDKKVGEISELCGFQDKSYFTKVFREKFGKVPLEVRKGR